MLRDWLSHRDCRKLLRAVRVSHTAFLAVIVAISCCAPARSQNLRYARKADVNNGRAVYNNGCVACHGTEGKGAPEKNTVFKRPDTWPDFTACDQTTPEPNAAYRAVILHGGKSLAFSQVMPAFGDYLSSQQIDDVIAYIRSLCKNVHHYPMGELNLPRALATEKAFPEDELVISSSANASGPASWTTDVIHEQTFKGKNQLEVDVPTNHAVLEGQGTTGVGDITIGLKREIFSSLRTGSLVSVQGGVLLPTGDSSRGFGRGTATFEPFVAYDQLFRENTFFQFQLGAELPVESSKAPRNMFFRSAVGQAWAPDHGLGRLFSPMVEFLASRDYSPGASTAWDVLPEMQVTVSRRQHIRAAVGYRKPITDVSGRAPQVSFYVLWDWAEGHFWDGWK